MEYKIGDVIRIKDDLQVGEKYGRCIVVQGMLKFRGIIDTIEHIDVDGDFYLSDNNNPYVWHKDMLKPVKYKIGYIIKVRNDLQKGEMYGDCEVLEGMLKYTGLMYIIDKIDIDGTYRLKSIDNPEDTNYYAWHEDMLEPVIIKNDSKQSTTPKIDRLGIYQYLLNNLEETYRDTNDNDQDNTIVDIYDKFGDTSFLIRILERYNELSRLCNPNEPQELDDEKINETILDLANHCLLWLTEREYKNQ